MTETPAPKNRIQIQIPTNLEPVYANFAVLTHSPPRSSSTSPSCCPRSPRRG